MMSQNSGFRNFWLNKRAGKVIFLIAFVMMVSNSESKDNKEAAKNKTEKATFAGGCFWCMQPPFDELKGVISTVVGYTGGTKENPTYLEVSDGGTGHAEAIEVTYDPTQITYQQLLDLFWKNIDPTVINRQFCDVGDQYRSAIFYHNAEQKKLAEDTKEKLLNSGRFGKRVFTEISPASKFYKAEEYHQKYYQKNPVRYKIYKYNCGRAQTLKKLWGT